MALCHCGGNGETQTSEPSADAGDDRPAVVILRDAAPQPSLEDAGDASVGDAPADATIDGSSGDSASDAAGGDGAGGDGAGGDGTGGDGALDGTPGDAASRDSTCGAAPCADGSTDGANGDAALEAGPSCDAAAPPKDEACVLDVAYGVFVAVPSADAGAARDSGVADSAADGGDSAAPTAPDGSPSNPFPTILDALNQLGNRSRIYICDGTYREQVTITMPVSLFGGLSCTGGIWRWDGGITQVLSPSPNYALSVTGLNNAAIDVQDLAFTAPDATLPGASSVAALIAASTVTLTRVVLVAGRGANGADGEAGPSNYSGDTAQAGGDYTPGTAACVDRDTSSGGAGAPSCDNTNDTCDEAAESGASGTADPFPPISGEHDGIGGAWDNTVTIAVPGDPGANGLPRSGGEPAASVGAIVGDAWNPTQGTQGGPGGPGQGGGGGSSFFCSSLGGEIVQVFVEGGGGGAGGCGGAGGLGGGGGGASIALMSVNNSNPITLVSCALTASQGGAGGIGGQGQDGQMGGNGYTFGSMAKGECPPGGAGGAGGLGAGGSGGGGGTGGVSVGILFRGPQPIADTATGITPGVAGSPGSGGIGGSQTLLTVGNPGALGLPGISAEFLGPL
jgi:hypothetical protein